MIVEEGLVEDINNILNSKGEVPALFDGQEKSYMLGHTRVRREHQRAHGKDSTVPDVHQPRAR